MSCCGEVAKEGDVYVCEDCGLEVKIVKGCSCTSCDLLCCGKPLKKR